MKKSTRFSRIMICAVVYLAVMLLILEVFPFWIMLGIDLLLLITFMRQGMIRIPQKHYAIFNLLGKRWRVSDEGIEVKLPLIESYELYSMELDRLEVKLTAKTKDLLGIVKEGAVEFKPDSDPEMLIKYDNTKRNLANAIIDTIKSELGALAGTKNARDFVEKREAINLIINCKLRLKNVPHKNPKNFGEELDIIPLEGRLDFYKKHADAIQDILDKESGNSEEYSQIEEAYGIDISLFDLTKLDYTEKTNVAFEEKEQAKARVEAADYELDLVTKYAQKGASAQEAINAAQVFFREGERKVHSVEGLSRLFTGGDK